MTEIRKNNNIRVITDYLDETAKNHPDKLSFVDSNRGLTFSQLRMESLQIATTLIKKEYFKKPVAVFLDQSVECISSFMGIAYAGDFYTLIDTKMPTARIEKIMSTLNPAAIITDEKHKDTAETFAAGTDVLIYKDLMKTPADEKSVYDTVEKIVDTDIIYVLFTSGSTGIPKGVTIGHRSLIDFTEWTTSAFDINSNDVFGNQVPFFFDHSLTDIYGTLKSGATLYIIPKKCFIFPIKLLEFIKEKQVNTVVFVPSVLCNVANLDLLTKCDVTCLKKIIFGGEAMPNKQLNYWRRNIPDALYGNIYGPTEGTGVCAFYIANRSFADNESFPIGWPCRNADVFVLNEKNKLVQGNEQGELCIRGTSLAYGYYNNPERTDAAFVQNPLNTAYPEKIYRTGDVVHYNDRGELIYDGRKDFQIKHNGHRIELGEIDTEVSSLDGVDMCCALYDKANDKIVLYYTGTAEIAWIRKSLATLIPDYMIPNVIEKLDEIPLNLNGKIDRAFLNQKVNEGK